MYMYIQKVLAPEILGTSGLFSSALTLSASLAAPDGSEVSQGAVTAIAQAKAQEASVLDAFPSNRFRHCSTPSVIVHIEDAWLATSHGGLGNVLGQARLLLPLRPCWVCHTSAPCDEAGESGM